jgi:hypothetical protein
VTQPKRVFPNRLGFDKIGYAHGPAHRRFAGRDLPKRSSSCPRHILGPGWVAVIDLIELKVRESIGCDEREARRILRLIAGHQEALMDAWRRFHG